MKKRFLIIMIILVLLISVSSLYVFYNKDDKSIAEKEKISFSFKDITSLEFKSYSLNDFVNNDIKCIDNRCFYLDKDIEYTISDINSLGKQNVQIEITYDGEKYNHIYEIEVKDETLPEIVLVNDIIELNLNDEFDPKNYINSINDNYDGDLSNNVIVETNVDINKEGEYSITYSVTDSNGNTNKKELPVIVKAKDNKNTTTTNVVDKTTKVTIKTTKKITTTSKNKTTTVNKKTTFKDNVNSVKLTPVKTRYKELDKQIDKVVADINKKHNNNYDRLLAAYDYVMNYLSYEMVFIWGNTIYEMMDHYGYNYNDAHEVLLALLALENKTGVCDSYAALFMIITRNMGFDSYVMGGQVKTVSGGSTGHAWVTIKVNGTYYLFDPQIEDSKNGKQRLVYFGKTDKELKIYTYNRESNIKAFNYFKKLPEASSTVEVTGDINVKDSFEFKGYNETRYPSALNVKKGDVLNIKVSATGVSKYSFKLYYYDGNESSTRKVLVSSSSKELNYQINCNEVAKMRLEIEVEEGTNGRRHMIYYPVNISE